MAYYHGEPSRLSFNLSVIIKAGRGKAHDQPFGVWDSVPCVWGAVPFSLFLRLELGNQLFKALALLGNLQDFEPFGFPCKPRKG